MRNVECGLRASVHILYPTHSTFRNPRSAFSAEGQPVPRRMGGPRCVDQNGARLERKTDTRSDQAKVVSRFVDNFVTAVGEDSDVASEPIFEPAAPMSFQQDIVIIVVSECSADTVGEGIKKV
jgi:hypothetical protein